MADRRCHFCLRYLTFWLHWSITYSSSLPGTCAIVFCLLHYARREDDRNANWISQCHFSFSSTQMVELSWMSRFQVQVGLCWSNYFRIRSGTSCCMDRSLCKLSLSSTSHLELHRSNYVRRLSSELWSMYVRRTMLVDLNLKLMLQYLGRTIRSSRTTSLELGSSIEFWIMIDVRSSNYVRRFDS